MHSAGIGLDSYNGKTPPMGASSKNSAWADDSGSTVGFARLNDEEGLLSPIDMQRSVYGAAPIGAAVTTPSRYDEKKIPSTGIMKESRIDQHSEIVK